MKARELTIIMLAIFVVVMTVILVVGYTMPFSKIRVKVYNAWNSETSFVVYIDNATDGIAHVVPAFAQMVVGSWSVHMGSHTVSIVSDDFPNMVYNTKVLTQTVHNWPYETETVFWGLALA